MRYFKLHELISYMDEPYRTKCMKLYNDNYARFYLAPGSSANHQAWSPGGYIAHIEEVMNIAIVLYEVLNGLRKLPFSLSDALVVLFLHDIEKPWKYVDKISFKNKQERAEFRQKIIDAYKIPITPEQKNALKYAGGEHVDYSPNKRSMNELAAFVHMCDVASARLWYDQPQQAGSW